MQILMYNNLAQNIREFIFHTYMSVYMYITMTTPEVIIVKY